MRNVYKEREGEGEKGRSRDRAIDSGSARERVFVCVREKNREEKKREGETKNRLSEERYSWLIKNRFENRFGSYSMKSPETLRKLLPRQHMIFYFVLLFISPSTSLILLYLLSKKIISVLLSPPS